MEDTQVDLSLRDSAEGTWIDRQLVRYPFHLGRCWHVDGDPGGMLTGYLQCTSGGLFAGDRIRWRIALAAGARAHLTSAASTIVHSMPGGSASQHVVIEAGAGAWFEYLPDPMVLFPQASVDVDLSVTLDPQATVMLADQYVVHDYEGRGRGFERLSTRLAVRGPDGTPLVIDRFDVTGQTWQARRAGLTGDHGCMGSFFVITRHGDPVALLAAIRQAVDSCGAYAGVSLLPSNAGVLLRCLAADAVALRATIEAAWRAVRRQMTGCDPRPRRK